MRHNKKFNHLGRKSAHRGAMLSNMCISLIMHKRIFTTVAKAKALKKVAEPIITRSKEDTTHSRRQVFQQLQNKEAVTELFQNISQKVADRPGGYLRIIKTGNRLGDNASMCFIELVDYNENMLKEKAGSGKKRTRRAGKKKDEASATEEKAPKAAKAPKAETTEEAPAKEKAAPKAKAPKAEEPKEEVAAAAVETPAEAAPAAEETETPAAEDEAKKEE
jgi:large subunit ribosomal protein L17